MALKFYDNVDAICMCTKWNAFSVVVDCELLNIQIDQKDTITSMFANGYRNVSERLGIKSILKQQMNFIRIGIVFNLMVHGMDVHGRAVGEL